MKIKNLGMANQRKRIRAKARRDWRDLTGAKPRKPVKYKDATMNINWNHVAGQWTQYKGKAREQWDELTDDELVEVNGRFEMLAEKIQEKYGIEPEEAKQQIDMWAANLKV